jgi:quinol monooxygenase YgiN
MSESMAEAMPKVSAVTRLVAHDGRFPELLEAVDRMVAAARAEEGTELYVVNRATREPNTLFLFEMFRDKPALKAHVAAGGPVNELLAPLVASSEVLLGEPVLGTGIAL